MTSTTLLEADIWSAVEMLSSEMRGSHAVAFFTGADGYSVLLADVASL
jgi:hypothetical protein